MVKNNTINGVKLIGDLDNKTFCKGCVLGKQHEMFHKFQDPRERAIIPGGHSY